MAMAMAMVMVDRLQQCGYGDGNEDNEKQIARGKWDFKVAGITHLTINDCIGLNTL